MRALSAAFPRVGYLTMLCEWFTSCFSRRPPDLSNQTITCIDPSRERRRPESRSQRPCPSAQLRKDGETYILSAFIFDESQKPLRVPVQEIYLRTRSRAIVQYCFFEHDEMPSIDGFSSIDFYGIDTARFILRFRRCGAVALRHFDRSYWKCDGKILERFQGIVRSGSRGWIFGWPAPEDESSAEPIWFLDTSDDSFRDDFIGKRDYQNSDDYDAARRQLLRDWEHIEGLVSLVPLRERDSEAVFPNPLNVPIVLKPFSSACQN